MLNGINVLGGIEVRTDRFLTKTEFVPFVKERFVEYEPKDWGWLLYFGYGELKQVPDHTKVYELNWQGKRVLLMHPATLELLKKHVAADAGKRV